MHGAYFSRAHVLSYIWTFTYYYRYISEVLPLSDWSNELVKTSVCLLVKRIERLMGKVQKKRLLRGRRSSFV